MAVGAALAPAVYMKAPWAAAEEEKGKGGGIEERKGIAKATLEAAFWLREERNMRDGRRMR